MFSYRITADWLKVTASKKIVLIIIHHHSVMPSPSDQHMKHRSGFIIRGRLHQLEGKSAIAILKHRPRYLDPDLLSSSRGLNTPKHNHAHLLLMLS